MSTGEVVGLVVMCSGWASFWTFVLVVTRADARERRQMKHDDDLNAARTEASRGDRQ